MLNIEVIKMDLDVEQTCVKEILENRVSDYVDEPIKDLALVKECYIFEIKPISFISENCLNEIIEIL